MVSNGVKARDLREVGTIGKALAYRCAVDVFGYCHKEGRTSFSFDCMESPKTCGVFKNFSEVVKAEEGLSGTYKHTTVSPEGEAETTEKSKPKTKRAKKLEGEIAQQRMV